MTIRRNFHFREKRCQASEQCPLFLLFLVVVAYDGSAVTSAQQLPVPTAAAAVEAREDKSRDHKRPLWLPKIARHLGGLATADSSHLFNWLQPTKHLASLFTAEVDDDTEPDMAGSVNSMNRWKTSNWRPPGPSRNQHSNYLFDDSNNYLHEFFAAETQQQRPRQQRPHRQFVRTQQQHQQRKHRPPPMMFSRRPMMISHPRPPMMMMNHGGGNRHHHQQNHHQQNYHHQNHHSFQGMQMQSFMHQNQQYQQQHHHQQQQQNFMLPPMNFMPHPGYMSNSGGGGSFEEGSEGNPIKGAVISHHHEQQVFNVPGQFMQQQQQYGEPTMVHIEGNVYPITLSWNTFSSPLMEGHQDSEGAYSSHAELVSHTHHKPIYREVHQMVSGSPYHHDNWNYHQMGHHQNSGGDHHHYHHQQPPPPPPHQLYHRRSSQETTTTSDDNDSRTHEHHQSHHTSKKPPPPPIEKKIGKS